MNPLKWIQAHKGKKRSGLASLVIEIAVAFVLITYLLAAQITSLSTTVTTAWQAGVGPILLQAVPIFAGIAILLAIYAKVKSNI